MTATRPAVRAIAKGITLGLTAVAIGGVTVAYATDDPYTLTRDGIQLAQPFEPNGHLNVRTDTGVTFNIHAEAKCITRTDAECAGKRHDVAQYIGATFIPWTVIGVPDDACVAWVQRSGANYHYGERGESAYCLTEEEPCPTETPSTEPTPTTEPEPTATTQPEPQPSSEPTPADGPSSPDPEPSAPEPTPTHPESPSSSPSPTTGPSTPTSSTPPARTPSATPVSTDPTTTSAAPTPNTPAAARTTATPTTGTTAPELADTGINLTPWWVLTGAVGLIVTGILVRLVRPKRGDE